MKKQFLTLLCLVLTSAAAIAQNFEGTVLFDFKMEGEMAAQLEALGKTQYEFKFKGDNMRMALKGGMAAMMPMDIIMDNKNGVAYMMNAKSKTAQKIETANAEAAAKTDKPKVTKEAETSVIAGYKCQKYKVETTVEGTTMVEYIWACSDLKVAKPKPGVKTNASQFMREGVEGFPLKIVTQNDMIGTITMLATSVKKESISDDMFKVPSDYKVEKFDAEKMMRGLNEGR